MADAARDAARWSGPKGCGAGGHQVVRWRVPDRAHASIRRDPGGWCWRRIAGRGRDRSRAAIGPDVCRRAGRCADHPGIGGAACERISGRARADAGNLRRIHGFRRGAGPDIGKQGPASVPAH